MYQQKEKHFTENYLRSSYGNLSTVSGAFVNPKSKEDQVRKRLLQRQAQNDHEKNCFTDEKNFTLEEKYNKENDKIRIYVRSSKEAKMSVPRVQKGHHPASVVVWWGVSYQGATTLQFCKQRVKSGARHHFACCTSQL